MIRVSKQRCLLTFLIFLIALTFEAVAQENDHQNDKPALVQAVKPITGPLPILRGSPSASSFKALSAYRWPREKLRWRENGARPKSKLNWMK